MLGTADLALLDQLFGQLPDCPFFVKDSHLRYVAANPAMARLCGVERPQSLIGRTAGDMFPAPVAARYEALDRRLLAGGRPLKDRLELSTGSHGDPAWLLFSRFPIRDLDGKAVGIAATSRRLPAPDRNHPTYVRLAAVVDRIRRNFDSPLDAVRLARLAGVSKSQLERDFFRHFAMTMQSFLHAQRMEHALEKLGGGLSITRIAQECGYTDHSAFTRRFRAVVGLAPREYRAHLDERRRHPPSAST